ELGRLVDDDRCRGDVGAGVGERPLKGRQVYEGLERGAVLALGGRRPVVLRLLVGASADDRQDFAGARIDGDERRLRDARLPFRQQLLDAGDAVTDRVLRDALQVQVERRI